MSALCKVALTINICFLRSIRGWLRGTTFKLMYLFSYISDVSFRDLNIHYPSRFVLQSNFTLELICPFLSILLSYDLEVHHMHICILIRSFLFL